MTASVTFYLPSVSDIAALRKIPADEAWDQLPAGEGAWILQTYARLRYAGADVQLDNQLPSSGTVVFHRRNKADLFKHPAKAFKNIMLVGVRGDLHSLKVCDFEIVQNGCFANNRDCFWIPHWPQPNLLPRSLERGATLKRIAYKGFKSQLHPDFKCNDWLVFLQSRGIEWVDQSTFFSAENPKQIDVRVWSDYRDIDLILAVRAADKHNHRNKPASKLVNSWHARTPAILGREYAYREIGSHGKNYIEVTNRREAERAIITLQDKPDLFQALIDNGIKQASEFTIEKITDHWMHFLFKEIPKKYLRHETRHSFWRSLPISTRYQIKKVTSLINRQKGS